MAPHGFRLLLGALLLASCAAPTAPTGSRAPAPPADAVAGELVIKVRPGTSPGELDALRARFGIQAHEVLLPGIERWVLASDQSAATPEAIARDKAIAFAQPNYLRHVEATPYNDQAFASQWYLTASGGINVQPAWDRFTTPPGTGVIVAIVDTGVDPRHPDLRANLIDDPTASTSTYPYGKKFIDEVGDGKDGSDAPYHYRDGYGHGTHVAGIVGAVGGNLEGIVGVAPGVKLLPVKTMRSDGDGDDFTIAKGLRDAADAGADVINLSVGGPAPSPVLAEAIAYDFRHGATVVIAAGNARGTTGSCYYPAAYTGVIAVAAVGVDLKVTNYSNYGSQIALAAPGGDSSSDSRRGIYSTMPTYPCTLTTTGGKPQKYAVQSGTSMATPIVSGVAALVIADARLHHLTLDPEQVRERLIATATPLGGVRFSLDTGFGLVNPLAALTGGSHDAVTP